MDKVFLLFLRGYKLTSHCQIPESNWLFSLPTIIPGRSQSLRSLLKRSLPTLPKSTGPIKTDKHDECNILTRLWGEEPTTRRLSISRASPPLNPVPVKRVISSPESVYLNLVPRFFICFTVFTWWSQGSSTRCARSAGILPSSCVVCTPQGGGIDSLSSPSSWPHVPRQLIIFNFNHCVLSTLFHSHLIPSSALLPGLTATPDIHLVYLSNKWNVIITWDWIPGVSSESNDWNGHIFNHVAWGRWACSCLSADTPISTFFRFYHGKYILLKYSIAEDEIKH